MSGVLQKTRQRQSDSSPEERQYQPTVKLQLPPGADPSDSTVVVEALRAMEEVVRSASSNSTENANGSIEPQAKTGNEDKVAEQGPAIEAVAADTANNATLTMPPALTLTPLPATETQHANSPLQHLKVLQALEPGRFAQVYYVQDPISHSKTLIKFPTEHAFEVGATTSIIDEVRRINLAREQDALHFPAYAFVDIATYNFPTSSMEYIALSLKDEIEAGLKLEDALSYFVHMCESLEACERAGFRQLDPKPDCWRLRPYPDQNLKIPVMVDLNVCDDFKIQSFQGLSSLDIDRRHNRIAGTLSYMSPEQIQGASVQELTPQSLVYSMGTILFEMISGKLPVGSDQKISNPFVRPIVDRARRAEPSERYANITELKEEVLTLLQKTRSPVAEPKETQELRQPTVSLPKVSRTPLTDIELSESLINRVILHCDPPPQINAVQKRILVKALSNAWRITQENYANEEEKLFDGLDELHQQADVDRIVPVIHGVFTEIENHLDNSQRELLSSKLKQWARSHHDPRSFCIALNALQSIDNGLAIEWATSKLAHAINHTTTRFFGRQDETYRTAVNFLLPYVDLDPVRRILTPFARLLLDIDGYTGKASDIMTIVSALKKYQREPEVKDLFEQIGVFRMTYLKAGSFAESIMAKVFP